MEYTVQNLAKLAGVSARTLRYYDEIGLLIPARLSSSGYRIYGKTEVDRLQQIISFRQCVSRCNSNICNLFTPSRIGRIPSHIIRSVSLGSILKPK